MNVPSNPIADRRQKGIFDLYNSCFPPIFCSFQMRDCILRGLLAENGKANKMHESLGCQPQMVKFDN